MANPVTEQSAWPIDMPESAEPPEPIDPTRQGFWARHGGESRRWFPDVEAPGIVGWKAYTLTQDGGMPMLVGYNAPGHYPTGLHRGTCAGRSAERKGLVYEENQGDGSGPRAPKTLPTPTGSYIERIVARPRREPAYTFEPCERPGWFNCPGHCGIHTFACLRPDHPRARPEDVPVMALTYSYGSVSEYDCHFGLAYRAEYVRVHALLVAEAVATRRRQHDVAAHLGRAYGADWTVITGCGDARALPVEAFAAVAEELGLPGVRPLVISPY